MHEATSEPTSTTATSKWIRIVIISSMACGLLLLAAPLGTRIGLWQFELGLGLLVIAFILALVTLVPAIILLAMMLRRANPQGLWLLLVGVLPALAVALIVSQQIRLGGQVPKIHNISTDPEDPPKFYEIATIRAGQKAAPLAYKHPEPGQNIADVQRAAYPHIVPIVSNLPVAEAFTRALALATSLGWEIVNASPAGGVIEATETTFWFGFKDDIVIRIRAAGTGSRIDLRSVSRLGISDLGKNAQRIHEFIQAW